MKSGLRRLKVERFLKLRNINNATAPPISKMMDGIKFLVKTPITISKMPSTITNQASGLIPLINGKIVNIRPCIMPSKFL